MAFSRCERLLHRFAFATPLAQVGLADLETRWHRRELAQVTPGKPVFVVGVPRAGSTMLLHLLSACPSFASHQLRDMPFPLCPLTWRPIAQRLGRTRAPVERAHGDGILVGPASPDALDEVAWLHASTRLGADFAAFYANHRRKLIALQRRQEPRAQRYLAKNNNLLGRLAAVEAVVPEAMLVVPFRAPQVQAESLRRQHARFLALHAQDRFAHASMVATGHREFGRGAVQFDFCGGTVAVAAEAAQQVDGWLRYYAQGYSALLAATAQLRLCFVDFEQLANTRETTRLADWLELGDADRAALQQAAGQLRALPTAGEIPPVCAQVYGALQRASRGC